MALELLFHKSKTILKQNGYFLGLNLCIPYGLEL